MKNKKQRLRDQADGLWKIAVIDRWGNICESCGKESLTPHHFFAKGLYPELRYEVNNGVPLCSKCHFFHHHKVSPEIHLDVIEKRGKKWYNRLEEKSRENQLSFQTEEWYQKQIQQLKNLT